MDTELLRIYDPENECGDDGYPFAWHRGMEIVGFMELAPAIKNLVREQVDHRCIRCGHPYRAGDERISPRGEWSPCDEGCTHKQVTVEIEPVWYRDTSPGSGTRERVMWPYWAQWRILTVHHLNGAKYDCRWWNLAALCQRCHLTIQGKVLMERVYPLEHSEWFKPYAAGWYASAYLGEDLTREETMERLDELLALERVA